MAGLRLRSLVVLAVVMTVSVGALEASAVAAAGGPIETARVRQWPAALIRVVRSLVRSDEREPTAPGLRAPPVRGQTACFRARDDRVRSPGSAMARLGLIDLPPPTVR